MDQNYDNFIEFLSFYDCPCYTCNNPIYSLHIEPCIFKIPIQGNCLNLSCIYFILELNEISENVSGLNFVKNAIIKVLDHEKIVYDFTNFIKLVIGKKLLVKLDTPNIEKIDKDIAIELFDHDIEIGLATYYVKNVRIAFSQDVK